jgi:hypothetical protein
MAVSEKSVKKLSEKGFEYRFGSEFDRCTKAGELEPGAFRPF